MTNLLTLHGTSNTDIQEIDVKRANGDGQLSKSRSVSLIKSDPCRTTLNFRGCLIYQCMLSAVLLISVVTAHAGTIRVPPAKIYFTGPYGGKPPGKVYGSPEEACASPEQMNWFGIAGRWTFAFVGDLDVGWDIWKGDYCHYKDEVGGIRNLGSAGKIFKCPSGFTADTSLNATPCYGNWAYDPKNAGASQPSVCNPINPANGNKYQIEIDYTGTGPYPLTFWRTYNARNELPTLSLGPNWHGTFHRSLGIYPTYALVYRPDGKLLQFNFANGLYSASGDIADKLTTITNGSAQVTGYRYVFSDGDEVEIYDSTGKILSSTNRSGFIHTYGYDNNGRLATITDGFGRSISFAYDTGARGVNRIVTMTDPLMNVYRYSYDTQGNLAKVIHPDGKARIYHYNEPAYTGGADLVAALTGITDENGVRYAVYRYDSTGKAISTEHVGGANLATLVYNPDSTTVTDPLGTTRAYNFQTIHGVVKNTGQSQPGGAGCGPASFSTSYDANGNVASRTDFNGVQTTFSYDLARNLETKRVEAAGTPEVRTISTEWHPTYRLPTKIAETKRLTINTYDDKGNLLSKTVHATSDETGAQGFTAATVGTPRTWRYTYNPYGQVLTATGPRTDVADTTRYAYDEQGNLSTITNAAGQVTTLSQYDANGRVGKMVDPNGLVTELAYSPRGWLTAKTVGGETTSYEYDGVGQLKKVTLPDGAYVAYTYDDAHRLTGIADSLGNRIAYTLDAMGNRVKEEVQDPDGVLSRQTTRVYDALNRLQQITGGGQ